MHRFAAPLALAALALAAVVPAAPARAQDTPVPAAGQPLSYRIEVGDVVAITVLGHAEFSIGSTRVQTDRTISYFFGAIVAAGKTVAELEKEVAAQLVGKKQLVRPVVAVSVIARESRQVNLYGAVRTPGKVELRDGWKVLDALASSGGLPSDRYEFFTLIVYRADGTSRTIDIPKLYQGDLSQNFLLLPGDNLIVQEMDPARTLVRAVGEVRSPAAIVVPRDGSVVTLLNAAGGVTPGAALSRANILRNGKTITVDLRNYLKDGILPPEARLEAGDTLIVPANRDVYRINGAVVRAGDISYPDDRKITLFDAMTAAGIVSQGADLKKVRVTQKAADGQDVTTLVNVEKLLKGDRGGDIAIAPGDSIYVTPKAPRRPFSVQEISFGLGAITGIIALFNRLR